MTRLFTTIFFALLFPLLALVSIFVDIGDRAPAQERALQEQQGEKDPTVPPPAQENEGIRVPVPPSSFAPSTPPSLEPSSRALWEELVAAYYNTEPARLPASPYLASGTPLFLQGVQAPEFFPVRNWEIPTADIDAVSAIALEMPQEKVLYQKNSDEARPIASLTKLMTALVIMDSLSPKDHVSISPNAIETPGEAGGLFVEEVLSVEQLLYAMLLDSSNDAAVALGEAFDLHYADTEETIVSAMNKKAQELGLFTAFFEEPTGLHPHNRASAREVALLLARVYQNKTLRAIMATPIYETTSAEDVIAHRWVNRNNLLRQLEGVVGGKTGYTDEAGESMAVVTKITDERTMMTVVLGSKDRMAAQTALIDWIRDAYIWE